MLERAGQMICCGIAGTEIDDGIRRLIEEKRIGGVILFARNCPSPEVAADLVGKLQELAGGDLLVGIDQEGGRVMRLPSPPYKLPPAQMMARMFKPKEIEKVAFGLGKKLKELGINCDFAPVLDVATNPENTVIGDRAFGKHVGPVEKFGTAFFKGLQQAGVIPCGKHFPGHGDTLADSHHELPIWTHDRKRLNGIELKPFAKAIKNGLDMMMSAHVLYTQIDPDEPATLSPAILQGILREELGFKGVVVSDDLEMKAVAGRYSPAKLAEKLLAAGVDLWLVCHTYELADKLAKALVEKAKRDDEAARKLDASAARILELKRKYGIVKAVS